MRRPRMPRATPAGAAIGAVYLGFVAISLLQQPGRTTYDTRLELTERPGSFLASAFSLWHPDVDLGEVQNQANGYLFPQGPFFWLAHVVHVSPWVTQRLWSALVIIVACEGMRRVCRALDLPVSAAFLGGLVFALSPRLLGTSGVLTAEALPGAVAPWALLPMLLAVRGRLGLRPAVLLSAAAVVAMGGVNAVETGAAVVPVAVLVVWAAGRGLLSRRALAGWLGVVALATLWCTLPLLFLGRYSPPFYEYVESAATTTSFVGWSEAIRGDTHWLSWTVLPDGRPWWPAAHDLATDPLLVAVSALVAAAGLVGLARWRSRYRVPFAFSAGIGMAVLTIAHGGLAGTPFAGGARSALDGVLQIFRNVHKFDPSVRIAIAVGVAALFAEVVARVDLRTAPGTAGKWVILPACLVLVLGAPYLHNDSRTPGWTSFPDSWRQAAAWLAEHGGGSDGPGEGRAVLVLPASGFALQDWGATYDEPMLAMDVPHRVAMVQAPLLPGPSLRFLSALTTSVSTATATGVAGELARAGIGYVVVRGDLDQVETGTPTPDLSRTAMAAAGIEEVASFGADSVAPLTVYRIASTLPALRSAALDHAVTVAGEPESVLGLQETGLAGGPVVLQGEPGWRHPVDVVTDGAQRRERQFGSLYDALSVVLQAREPYRAKRAVPDYPGPPGARQVVAAYDGLVSLRASSSRGYADTFGEVVTAEGPAAAIDGDPATRWVSSPATEPTRQWLRLTFRGPRAVHQVSVRPVVGDPALAPVRTVEVVAGGQHRTLHVSPDGAAAVARFDGSRVRSVTVLVKAVGSAAKRAPVALSDVRVDGPVPHATLVVPEPLSAGTSFVFRTSAGVLPCVSARFGPDCDESRRRTPEEPAGLDRTFSVRAGASDEVTLTGSVVPRTSKRTLRLLEPVGREQRVAASSVLGEDPRVASRFAWDGSSESAWVPADNDPGPALTFRWSSPRTVSGISVESPDAGTAPARALLTSADGHSFAVTLTGSGTATFPAVRTRRLTVTFERREQGGRLVLDEVELAGADVTQPFDAAATTGAVCGLGPHLVVDGVVHQTRVRGTLGDLADGRPLALTVCDPAHPDAAGPPLVLGSGRHRIGAPPTSEFQTVTVVGRAERPAAATTPGRSLRLRTADGARRTADVGPGPASLVWMPQNANPGWRARLDGKALSSLRVDGWQQAWIVPAGSGGRLVIDYPPQAWYRVLLVVALIPAVVVLLLAVLLLLAPERRRREAAEPALGSPSPRAALGFATVLFLALGVVSAIAGLATSFGRRQRWLVPAAGLAVLASGLLDARDSGAPGNGLADLLAAAGFGILFVVALLGPEEDP